MNKNLIEAMEQHQSALLSLMNEVLKIVEYQSEINLHFATKLVQLQESMQSKSEYPYSNARESILKKGLEIGK